MKITAQHTQVPIFPFQIERTRLGPERPARLEPRTGHATLHPKRTQRSPGQDRSPNRVHRTSKRFQRQKRPQRRHGLGRKAVHQRQLLERQDIPITGPVIPDARHLVIGEHISRA